MPKSLIGWIALIVVVLLIVKNPTGAGTGVKHVWDSFMAFIGSI